MKTTTYNWTGKKDSELTLSDSVFALPKNNDLVHQVLVAYQANLRAGTAHTKDRSEVSGGGKKPWKQKGTGRARHGSSRSPIWVGGGIAHGPRNDRDYSQKINDKMRLKALGVILSDKANKGVVMSVSGIPTFTKTRDAETSLATLAGQVTGFETLLTYKNKNNVLLCVPDTIDAAVVKSLRNIPCVSVVQANRLNPLQAAKARYIILADAQSVDATLATRLGRISSKGATAKLAKAVK